MDLGDCVIVSVCDLAPGAVMASGIVVESVETRTRLYGESVHVGFTNGRTGTVGRKNRVWVKSGSVVPPRHDVLF